MLKRFTGESLKRYVELPRDLEPNLLAATHHTLDTQGGFGRANLAMGVGEALGMGKDKAEALGAAIELFHLASLILDDLPCMDDAEFRRSRKCVHRDFGEGSAILVALGFINRAYTILWDVFSMAPPKQRREAADLVDECLGFGGILDGQSRDIHFGGSFGRGDSVKRIAKQKTGSLIRLCLLLPAIICDASRYDKMHLARLTDNWGVAYQVADDLKDLRLSEASSGKSTQRDRLLGRPNMVLAIGEDAAARLLSGLIEMSERSLQQLDGIAVLSQFQAILIEKVEPLIAACAAA